MPINPSVPAVGVPPLTRKGLHDNFLAIGGELVAVRGRATLLETITIELQPASHGSMRMTGGPKSGADLGAGWQALDKMDTIIIHERNVTLNTFTGEIAFGVAGPWQVVFRVNFSHTPNVAMARQTMIRGVNVTDAEPGTPEPVSIGRDESSTSYVIEETFDLEPADVGKVHRFEIGGGDPVIGLSWNAMSMQCYFHGRLGKLEVP